MSASLSAEHQAVLGYLTSRWVRTNPACAEIALSHAHESVCPIASAGESWSASGPASTAPFLPAELLDRQAGGVTAYGCGWLLVSLRQIRSQVIACGNPPVQEAEMALDIAIAVPPGSGLETAQAYASALVQFFPPGGALDVSANHYLEWRSQPVQVVQLGQSNGWDWFRLEINFCRYW